MRLTERAYRLGLAKRERYDLLTAKRDSVDRLIRFSKTILAKPALYKRRFEVWEQPLARVRLIDLILRPQLDILKISTLVPALKQEISVIKNRREEIVEAAEIKMKYQGYIDREKMIADKISRLEIYSHTRKIQLCECDTCIIDRSSSEIGRKNRSRNHSAGFAHTGYFAERYKHIAAIGGTLMFHVKQIARKPLNKGIERIKQ